MYHKALLMGIVIILTACLAALIGTVSAQAGLAFTVDDTSDALDANPGDGRCATAGGTCTLRAAIMETNALAGADTVILPPGLYLLTIGGSGEDMATLGDLDIADDLTISGAGAESTIIDGNGSRVQDRVVHIVDSGVKAVITGVTVRNGGSASYARGGIWGGGGDLALSDCAVVDNMGPGIEGASNLTVTKSIVSSNTDYGIRGGASVVVSDSGIHNNGGSGIVCSDCDLLLENSTVSGNTQETGLRRGGGISHDDGVAMVINSTIRDNTAKGAGGIRSGGTLIVISSTICGNTGGNGGIGAQGMIVVDDSTVCSNSGGGISASGTLHLTNTTISDNTGGGGVHGGSGSLNLNNVTITGNVASGDGGGIHVHPDNSISVANSIIAGNTDQSPQTKHPDCSGTMISQGYNLIGDTTGCFIGGNTTGNLTGVDPVLGPLKDNGGPTLTHALFPESPAINAGNPAGCTDRMGNPLLKDQRGRPRSGRCDMGAYEFEKLALDLSRKSVSVLAAMPGEPFTYTIVINNAEPDEITHVLMTDTLPAFVTYADNSLTASAGDYGYENGTVTWAGSVDAAGTVTVAFGATVSDTAPLGTSIANTAIISGGGKIISRSATFHAGPQIYLPIMMKGGR